MKEKIPSKQNIAVSAGLNIIRKACMVAFPLITYSYATRVLGAEGIGVHEFAQSIVSYFALIAALGITQYAVRDGAILVKAHDARLDDFASEVFSINMCMTVIAYVLLGISIAVIPLLKSNGPAIMIASTLILFTTLGVDWVNSLFEDYLYLTIRYIAVSLISLVLLFVLVRSPKDIYNYIFIANFATIANGILNFLYIRRFVKIRFTFNMNLAKHALPIFVLFCNNIASVIYLNSDVTILRILTDSRQVGLYGVAAKIYTMLKELINAAIFVTIPRFTVYAAKHVRNTEEQAGNTGKEGIESNAEGEGAVREDKTTVNGCSEEAGRMDEYMKGLRRLLTPLFAFLMPACVGLFFLSGNVIDIVAGNDFLEGAGALRVLSVAMFFAVMACFVAYAVIMPYKLEKYFLAATSTAALVNIILNFLLIPHLGLIAAAYTTLLAEIMVFGFLSFVAASRVRFRKVMDKRDAVSVLIGTMLVAAVCAIMGKILTGSVIASGAALAGQGLGYVLGCTAAIVAAAVILYAAVLAVMKNSVAMAVIGKIKSRAKM